MESVGIFNGYLECRYYYCLVYFTCSRLVILWQFGIFFSVLVYCVKKNLAIQLACIEFEQELARLSACIKGKPGANVMITILCDFRQFPAKKIAFFS
jgi:hypothetical protein